jgi:uncharacterized DUF497 family protein
MKKAAANLLKHGVSVEGAQTLFADENTQFIDDLGHSEEKDRFVLLGLSSSLPLLPAARQRRPPYLRPQG